MSLEMKCFDKFPLFLESIKRVLQTFAIYDV